MGAGAHGSVPLKARRAAQRHGPTVWEVAEVTMRLISASQEHRLNQAELVKAVRKTKSRAPSAKEAIAAALVHEMCDLPTACDLTLSPRSRDSLQSTERCFVVQTTASAQMLAREH